MSRLSWVMLCFLAFASVRTATAQYPYGWGGGYHASTVGESYSRGMADVIRSAGAANLMNSAAAQNYEEAYSQDLDNQLKRTNTYFEMRSLNKQYRAAENGPRPTQEDLVRYSNERKPKPLSSSQADPLTGSLHWPLVLQDPAFADYTKHLDQLFSSRAANHGQVTLDEFNQIIQTTSALDGVLRSRIRDYPPQQYVKAKNFLQALAYEVNN